MKKEAIRDRFTMTDAQFKSSWKRVLISINSLGRDLARKAKKKAEMEELLVKFNTAISMTKDDQIDEALEMFMIIREDLEGMLNQSQPDSDLDDSSEEDSSDSD